MPEINIAFSGNKNLKIKTLSYNSIFDFSFKDNNNTADSLINAYMDSTGCCSRIPHRRSLTGLGPKTKNNFLANPNKNGVYALDNFFKALLKEKDSTIVRVAHYGDSQLEGDRITCYVRNYFQQKFGGSGIGFVPFDDVADNVNLVRVSSPNWLRFTVFHNRYGCGFYGLSGNVYKFTKYAVLKSKDDTIGNSRKDSASVKINPQEVFKSATIGITLRPFVNYSSVSLMYGFAHADCQINVYNQLNNQKILSEKLEPSEKFSLHKLDFPSSVRSFILEFSGDASPDFYGLLIDGKNGVQIDNYSIRGHSGDGLLLINPEYLATQLKKLNIKFVIFQYGNNVVPHVKSDEDCEQMGQMYSDLFTRFKRVAPEINILVVGVGDMAYMADGEYKSYPYIPKIRDAQKKAAINAGCAFWDLFEIMGGSNSVLTWTDKGLASHDGHFTTNGQKIIGKELFDALMIEYNQYTFRQRKKENS
jgi:hypothetical protein